MLQKPVPKSLRSQDPIEDILPESESRILDHSHSINLADIRLSDHR